MERKWPGVFEWHEFSCFLLPSVKLWIGKTCGWNHCCFLRCKWGTGLRNISLQCSPPVAAAWNVTGQKQFGKNFLPCAPFSLRSSLCKTKLEYEAGFIIKPRDYNFHIILFPIPTSQCLIIILCHNEIHEAATTKECMEENRSFSDGIDLHTNEDYDVINITKT